MDLANGVYQFANQKFGNLKGDDELREVSVAGLETKSSGFHCQRSKLPRSRTFPPIKWLVEYDICACILFEIL